MAEPIVNVVARFCVSIGQDQNREKVQIPVGFLECIPKRVWNNALLRLKCFSNRQWEVKLFLESDRLFLSKGWDKFFAENAICENETLMFEYLGGGKTMIFDVVIFGVNGRERVDMPNATNATNATSLPPGLQGESSRLTRSKMKWNLSKSSICTRSMSKRNGGGLDPASQA